MTAIAPMISTLIADRYELLEEMPRVTDGRLFRARDLAFDEHVAVKLLGTGCGMDVAGRQSLEIAVRRVQCNPHSHLLRHYALDAPAGVLVREWIHGFSLLDLLRRRHALTADEVFRLLSSLADTLDFLASRELPIPRPLLGKVFIQFAADVSPDSVLALPIAAWPAFTIKVNPLCLLGLLADTTSDTTRTAFFEARSAAAAAEAGGPRTFAGLLYEILGGRQRDTDTRRYTPLAALHEEGNGVLRRALLVAPHDNCHSLWRDLLAAQASIAMPAPSVSAGRQPLPQLSIPDQLIGNVQPGLALKLNPEDPAAPAVYLIARPRFTIGRSRQSADFVTRLLPESAANNTLTDRISRVHAIAESAGGHLLIRDGNGAAPSVNGSALDGHLLSPLHPHPLAQRAILSLGHEYALELIPLLDPAPRDWQITNLDSWRGKRTPAGNLAGALVCEPRNGQQAIRQSVWLFTEIGFGLDCSGRIIWDTRGCAESPAAFHHLHGCFWLRSHSMAGTALAVGDVAIAADEIAPLAAGATLRIGPTVFTIDIS
jgi:hypothetical protein